MVERLKERIALCEDGSSLLALFPGLMVVIFVMFALTANYQMWNGQKNEMQIIADSMSRAGACAISQSQAVHERTTNGDWSDWHVYNTLWSGGMYAGMGEKQGNAKRSMQEDAQMVLDEFNRRYSKAWEIEGTVAYNPAWAEIKAPLPVKSWIVSSIKPMQKPADGGIARQTRLYNLSSAEKALG